jgi:hypothetical protein
LTPSIVQFLAALRAKQLSVSLSGESLVLKGDPARLSEDERQALESRRAELVLYLKAHRAISQPLLTPGHAPRPAQSQISWWRWIRESPVQLSHERIGFSRRYTGVTQQAAQAALRQMAFRHPVLGTHFVETDGVLQARLHPPEQLPVDIETLPPELTGEAAEAEALRRAATFTSQPLPADGDWLVKFRIITFAPDGVVIALLFAHIVVDGISAQILADELELRLVGSAEAKQVLETPAPQFMDYAAWEEAWLQGPPGAVLTDYWLSWLDRQSPLQAPGGTQLTWRHGTNVTHAFTIPAVPRDAMQALAARHRTSVSLAFLTLYAMALARWSGQSHFPIRTVGNLRRTHAISALVGFMVCIEPVEVRVDSGADFRAVLKILIGEYYNAAMLRLPGFLKFPAQAAHPGIEQVKLSEAVAASFNYMPAARRAPVSPQTDFAWPPSTREVGRENWQALLWPIYLRLADTGQETQGFFQFNETLVSPAEQAALMAQFFAIIKDVTDEQASLS